MTETQYDEYVFIAAAALQGILSNNERLLGPTAAATSACDYADALLKEIEQRLISKKEKNE